MTSEGDYEVIIIGAGIGGLVSGCLLAKKGLRVALFEKSSRVGGYCASFGVKGYEFDAFAHALGNLSPGAQFHNILQDLKLFDDLEIVRFNPTDVLICPEQTINFYTDVDATIESFRESFFGESRSINYFFKELVNLEKTDSVRKFRNKTFEELLCEVFQDFKLRKILSLPILGNLGVSAKNINAFTAVKHYKQFMLDGGYYPSRGMQSLADKLANKFKDLGGDLFLSKAVKRILIKNQCATGVQLKGDSLFNSKFVISGSDGYGTFIDLVGQEHISDSIFKKLNEFQQSSSLFVLYIALGCSKLNAPIDGATTWVLFNYGFDEFFSDQMNCESDKISWVLVRPDYKRKNCMVLTHAPFESLDYWKEKKVDFKNRIISRVDEVFPELIKNAVFFHSIDPAGLFKWTGNFKGSGYGWAATKNQFMDPDFVRDSVIHNLFLCGHWSTVAQGIEGVAIVAERVSEIVFQRASKENG